ncbi:alpha/beta fold hydrolase [Actinacidiphila glaucinigra]
MTGTVHYRTVEVDGLEVFHREAGDPRAPVLLLLHGFPTSSHMFRNLIPALADRYRVIAPDHIGFGQSAMPAVTDFPYTFDALTKVTSGLLEQLGVDRFAMYVQDYGAPSDGGWRWRTRGGSPRSSARAATRTRRASRGPSGTACSPTPRTRTPKPRPRWAQRSPSRSHAGSI